ncbi:MAG: ATP-binding cassette domain-containing protein [Acidobacteriota bacterium]
MITISKLGKSYGSQKLFEDVSLQLNAGDRYGIVGANGSGKSTLLRILTGEETPSSGEVTTARRLRLGFLRQDHFLSDEQPIIEVAMMGDRDVHDAMVAKDELLAKPESEFDADRYAELEDLILQNDGYSLEARAGEILEGLGIPTERHREPLGNLSGGFKLRVLLAQTLAARPDAIILDEPTNHLDIVSMRWLEKFLSAFSGCVVVVSHDHRFLDNVCTKILDVDYETILSYTGNYSAFEAAKKEHRDRKEAEISKREAEIAHHQAFIDRFKAKATKARQASSKKKQMERIKIERLAPSSRRHPSFRFQQVRPSGREALKVEGIAKAYDDNLVLTGVDLQLMRGDRLGIIGPNGIGKSTLLKILVDDLAADAGEVDWGHETHLGYFAQDHRSDMTDGKATVLSWLWNFCPGETSSWVRGVLGRVLFSSDEVDKTLPNLSGGEAARLTFARFMVKQPNVLILDEPTNHLDMESIDALVNGLIEFEGTLIFVSHDRWFVSKLANRILELKPDGITDYKGSYEEYLLHCGDDHLDAEAVLKKARQQKKAERKSKAEAAAVKAEKTAPAKPALTKAQRRKLESERSSLTEELEGAESRVKEIEDAFCQPGFFDDTSRDEVRALEEERERLQSRTEEIMGRWEELEELLG